MLHKLEKDDQIRQQAMSKDNLLDDDEENVKNKEHNKEMEADKQKILKDYEMAFQRIREATGVADVNEVI